MDSESNIQSFIVKVWLEEITEEAGGGVWRGHVTHVPGGERRHIKDLDEIKAFIAPYLEGMGVRLQKCWRVRQCLGRLETCLRSKLGNGGHGTH